ncbi:MAG: hypothetical protein JEZ09_09905 [Salinivirgaceae bacterium]|nr:hypothetical protein [Salinivirgaceae bacterium]
MKILIVIKEYKSEFPNPISFKKGEKVLIESKETNYKGWVWVTVKNENSGWVPEQFLKIENDEGTTLVNYNAIELNISIGEKLELVNEVNGWYWVENVKGNLGWIPKENVRLIIE